MKKKLSVKSLKTLIGLVLLTTINLYQKYLSPLLGENCKHHPSCSHYSKLSITAHGPIKGIILTLARILRCNPWSLGGYDPVPKDVIYKKISTFKLFGNYQTELYQQHKK